MGSRSQPYQQHRRPQLRGNTNRACVAAMPGRFIQSFRVFCPECNQKVTHVGLIFQAPCGPAFSGRL